MKKFTRVVIAAMTVSFLAAPMANARDQHHPSPAAKHHVMPKKHTSSQKRHTSPQKKHTSSHHRLRRGHKLSNWNHYSRVNDYQRHGLKRPGHGQRWVKVDNSYLLISVASGVIAGIVAAH